jgi:hypothetical protein
MGCGEVGFGSAMLYLWPIWVIIGMMMALSLGGVWYEVHVTEELNVAALVTRAEFAPANDWQEYYRWPWGWNKRGSLDTYTTAVSCMVDGQNVTLYSGQRDIYESGRENIGQTVIARVAKVNRYFAVPWAREVDYKYALMGIE